MQQVARRVYILLRIVIQSDMMICSLSYSIGCSVSVVDRIPGVVQHRSSIHGTVSRARLPCSDYVVWRLLPQHRVCNHIRSKVS